MSQKGITTVIVVFCTILPKLVFRVMYIYTLQARIRIRICVPRRLDLDLTKIVQIRILFRAYMAEPNGILVVHCQKRFTKFVISN
jgi:hypothetical protein